MERKINDRRLAVTESTYKQNLVIGYDGMLASPVWISADRRDDAR